MADNIDAILCDIIAEEMDLDDDKVVVYDEGYEPPSDGSLYIVVSTRQSKTLSSKKYFDEDTNEEVKRVVSFTKLDIDITSLNRDALERKEEVIMALTSQYSLEKQIENSIRIMRNGDLMDLSFIESAAALKRFRVPVIISNIKEKRKTVDYFDRFSDPEEEIDE